MAEEITYYAIINEFTSRDSPSACSAVLSTTMARATKCSRGT